MYSIAHDSDGERGHTTGADGINGMGGMRLTSDEQGVTKEEVKPTSVRALFPSSF
jgi:hypothetical protein